MGYPEYLWKKTIDQTTTTPALHEQSEIFND